MGTLLLGFAGWWFFLRDYSSKTSENASFVGTQENVSVEKPTFFAQGIRWVTESVGLKPKDSTDASGDTTEPAVSGVDNQPIDLAAFPQSGPFLHQLPADVLSQFQRANSFEAQALLLERLRRDDLSSAFLLSRNLLKRFTYSTDKKVPEVQVLKRIVANIFKDMAIKSPGDTPDVNHDLLTVALNPQADVVGKVFALQILRELVPPDIELKQAFPVLQTLRNPEIWEQLK